MKNVKTRTFITLLCAAILILSVFLSISFTRKPSANAAGEQYFSAEQYTDSDYLLTPNGTPPNNEFNTIQKFATAIKTNNPNVTISDITQIIPLQYMESQETDATFAYNGKEYGFYVSKVGNRFDVLLIDFVFEQKEPTSDVAHIIGINPILQQSFKRSGTVGNYTWEKSSSGAYKYYVANPRFLTVLQNENALNFGDEGYSKTGDEGLIILESRVNYGNVAYATEGNLYFGILQVALNILLDCNKKIGTVVNIIKSGLDIYNNRNEVIIACNNENRIQTNMSKQSQSEDLFIEGYSRIAGFAPKTEIVLSDDTQSSAEIITVVDNASYRSRLTQICEFDIVRRHTNYSSMEYVTGTEENPSFSFTKERVLYDNHMPTPVLDTIEGSTSVYMLPNGNQQVSFTPQVTGAYTFTYPDNATLSLNGVSGSSFDLEKGRQYLFDLNNVSNSKVIGQFRCNVSQYNNEPVSVAVNGGQSRILKYVPSKTGDEYFQFTTQSITVQILDSTFSSMTQSNDGYIYSYFEAGKTYYLYITNNGNANKSVTILSRDINKLEIANGQTIGADDKIMWFANTDNIIKKFTLIVDSTEEHRNAIICKNNTTMGDTVITGNTKVISISLDAGEKCYVVFSHNDGSISVNLSVGDVEFIWVVDGTTRPNKTVTLNRHDSDDNKVGYKIELYTLENGNPKIKLNAQYTVYADDARMYSFNNDYLKIPYFGTYDASYPKKIHICPLGYDAFSLAITIGEGLKDPSHTITFKTNDWYNTSHDRAIHFKDDMPIMDVPTKNGNVFKGYFDSENGQGKQYYNENMAPNNPKFEDTNSVILYAYWQKIDYTITLHLEGQLSSPQGNTYTITVHYNENIPSISMTLNIPKGYTFVGFYDGRNGTGNRYFTRGLFNDAQKASELAYSQYLVEAPIPVGRWNKESGADLYSYIELLKCEYKYKCICKDCGQTELGRVDLQHNTTITLTPAVYLSTGCEHYGWNFITSQHIFYDPRYTPELVRSPIDGLVYPEYRFNAIYQDKNCVAEGTLITLADGRQVPVESLTGNEMLLVWNLKTGSFDSARILFIDKDPTQIYKVINLSFSDGTTVKVISEHAFWDFNLNKYVYLREDAAKYIGHWFNKQITCPDGSMSSVKVQLTSVDIRDEYTTAYSPVTYSHLCYYVNGMLSMPGGISGLFNIFEVDSDTMTIDYEAMARDIETYGLFTYEEFAELLPVPQDVFDAFNAQYFKVAIGKGLITMETLENLFVRYADFLV